MDHGAKNYLRYLQGDDEGLVEIIRAYKDPLFLFLYGIVRNEHTAEDLVEDTFFKLAAKRPHFSGKSTFKTWIFAIARNLALDHLRRMRRARIVVDVPLSDAYLPAEEEYVKREEKQLLLHALQGLPESYRQVLLLVYFESFAPREAAQILKKSEKQIYNLLNRAKGALREILEKEGYEYEKLP